jgi:hypothetical protein
MSENLSRDSHYRNLPFSPDLNHLKTEAKTLKKQFNSGDSRARNFASFHLAMVPGQLKLADAQFAIASCSENAAWKLFSFSLNMAPISIDPVPRITGCL